MHLFAADSSRYVCKLQYVCRVWEVASDKCIQRARPSLLLLVRQLLFMCTYRTSYVNQQRGLKLARKIKSARIVKRLLKFYHRFSRF